jgi:hypothetical protein
MEKHPQLRKGADYGLGSELRDHHELTSGLVG